MAGFGEVAEAFGFAYTLKKLISPDLSSYEPEKEDAILKRSVREVYFHLILISHEHKANKEYFEILKTKK